MLTHASEMNTENRAKLREGIPQTTSNISTTVMTQIQLL